jgi:hypothetical protein
MTVSAEWLRSQVAAFQPSAQDLGNPGGLLGNLQAHFSGLGLTFGSGTARADITGMVTRTSGGTGWIPGITFPIPYTVSMTMRLMPATDPYGNEIVSVQLAGQNAIDVSLPGAPAFMDVIVPPLAGFVAGQIRNALADLINQVVPDIVAHGLALASLPTATQLTLRTLVVDQAGITFQAVLGAVGTKLSTFQPTPLPTP